jgi:serine O-acetyltransferase
VSGLRTHIFDDLYRIHGKRDLKLLLNTFILNGGFRYLAVLRICQKLKSKKMLKLLLYPALRFYLYLIGVRYGIEIPVDTTIGEGFYIGHYGNIIINSKSKIGDNCNISQGVTIGRASRGKHKGAPIIGNNVYLGPSCIISGKVNIGDNAVIGAGAIVNFDVPINSVVASPRAIIISDKGSEGYVNRRV